MKKASNRWTRQRQMRKAIREMEIFVDTVRVKNPVIQEKKELARRALNDLRRIADDIDGVRI